MKLLINHLSRILFYTFVFVVKQRRHYSLEKMKNNAEDKNENNRIIVS